MEQLSAQRGGRLGDGGHQSVRAVNVVTRIGEDDQAFIVMTANAAPRRSAWPFTRRNQEDAVAQQTASYRGRLARPDEVPRLRSIEDAAGRMFSGLGLIDEAP